MQMLSPDSAGKQIMWKIPVDPMAGYQKTRSTLAQKGYIKVTIKKSPSGKYTCRHCNHENTVEIAPYTSGFPILQLYDKGRVVFGEELLKI